jgi:hypothetical protein
VGRQRPWDVLALSLSHPFSLCLSVSISSPRPNVFLLNSGGGGEGVPPSLGLLALWEVKGTLLETTCNSTA